MEATIIFLIVTAAVLAVYWGAGCGRCSRKKDSSSGGSAGTGFSGWGGDDSPGKSDAPGSGQHGQHNR